MTASILELVMNQEQLAGEYDLGPGLTPEAALQQLPPRLRQELAPVAEAFAAWHRSLAEDQELTGLRRVRLFSALKTAARLEGGNGTAALALPALAAGPQWAAWLADLIKAQALFPGTMDTRLPRRFALLARVVAPLRHLLDRIQTQVRRQLGLAEALLKPLEEDAGLGLDPLGQTRQLLSRFLSREDWREQDIFHLLLEFMEGSPTLYDEITLNTAFSLKRLQDEDQPAHRRVIAALVNEARGYLGDLPRQRRRIRGTGGSVWQEEDARRIVQSMAAMVGLAPADLPKLSAGWEEEEISWDFLARAAQEKRGAPLNALKPLEKASLFLAQEILPEKPGHRRFLRFLLENEEAYRQLLAACYASEGVQQAQLARLATAFNRHPANVENQVRYDPQEMARFLRVFFLRPDPVAAIVDREWKKDLYQTLKGLRGQALLPQVLHESQKIFRYITPEVMARVAMALEVPPGEIVRVIASYKEFTADPSGQVILYVCKGTACFLRGQPRLSRSLSARLGVEEGRVSPEGVQYLERDCFGECHLAPVVKVGQTFIAQVKPREIPDLVSRLLKGRSYENRSEFFKAIRDSLAEVDQLTLHHTFRVLSAPQVEDSPDRITGLNINGLGEIRALPQGQLLGTLLDRSYSFTYLDQSGASQYGTLVADEDDFLQAANVADPEVQAALGRTLRPRVLLQDGQVYLEGRAAPLGAYHSSTIAIEKPDGTCGSLVLDEENRKAPPQEERGLAAPVKRERPPEFFSRQDQVLLGFVEGVDPESIDSYLEKGGYGVLKKVLGHGRREKRWEPADIVQEITASSLRGRGGAGFPTGVKWREMLKARPQTRPEDEVQEDVKLMVANGDEGDPGAFMDRTLIQERPHQILEGMLIAALATGCRYGVIYVRKEYEDAVQCLENAVFEARRHGFLGRRVLGQLDFDFDVEIRLGAGAFVAGEKRAIMRAIEGKAAEPDLKAVSNIRRGLWGKPTLLNNVETFANVPLILTRGGAWFKDLGYEASGGTKIFSVAGIVNHTGLVEVRFGRTLRDVLAIAGGVQEGKRLAGVQIGGPSGAILSLTGIRSYLLDAPLDFDTFNRLGAMIGSGGLVFLGEDDDVVRLARHFTQWLAEESCGQCPPCLNGLVSLGATLDRVLQGEGTSLDIHVLWGKSDIIRAGSNCGLGQTAPNPVTSSLRFFPVAYLHYLLDNPRVDALELFQSLEALRLITREEQPQGIAFTLKKGLIKFIFEELQKRDRYRPAVESRSGKFLKQLNIPPTQVAIKGVRAEYSKETIAQHPYLMLGNVVKSGGAELQPQ